MPSDDGPKLNPDTGLPYWGEKLKLELKADIALLKATAVTQRDFMLWGAALGVAILLAVVYLGKGQEEAMKVQKEATQENKASILETRKDIRSLYWERRQDKPQGRLERPPEPIKSPEPEVK